MRPEIVRIDIGKQFSRLPAGRTPDDGQYNGQTFRERFLKTPLKEGKSVVISLDNAISYGSSFLEEAFGGLVRIHTMNLDSIRNLLKFETADPFLEDEIWSYVNGAADAISTAQ